MIYSENPIHNVIEGQIKAGIRICYDHQLYSSALKLLYSGIDVMAFLSMPKERVSVKKSHFVAWADKYVKFPGEEQLSGEEMYVARCELLHTHRAHYQKFPNDKCRTIVYADKKEPPIIYNPNVNNTVVLVSVLHFMQAFFGGMDRFLIEVYDNAANAVTIEKRFGSLFQNMPTNRNAPSTGGETAP